jgi:hypothetical protein
MRVWVRVPDSFKQAFAFKIAAEPLTTVDNGYDASSPPDY